MTDSESIQYFEAIQCNLIICTQKKHDKQHTELFFRKLIHS
jgi:hypothetical protein